MKQHYFYLFFFILLGLLPEVKAQSMQFTGSNPMLISISDGKKNYLFTAPEIKGRYNNRLKRFEFVLMVANISPKPNNSLLVSLFNFIFHPDQSEEVRMFAYLPSETRGFEGFVNPRTLLLTGQIEIAGKSYQLPITMNLKYTSGILYYGLQGLIASDFGIIASTGEEKEIHPREIQFVIPESPMGIYMED
ncbi:hypothetical protein QNI19_00245 [Cytophagaceae bacterium DM2B3-1]|uniref:Uncharacterized protein n=1 Tax=Xanthocytophaga flava TaxID=3048013 RepID=A0ABT7CCK6_9BACT|nr:hypothetical protein [Xanthocytophaga flavus]MDJ1491333.1 hypothetical protein [Xanthocytophaga flavus]